MPLSPISLPITIEGLPHRDLSGRVEIGDNTHGEPRSIGGGYGDIFLGHLTEEDNTKIKVAIKVLRIPNDKETIARVKKSLIREVALWQQLQHKNVLQFVGLAPEYGRYGCPALISPYCQLGTAKEYLQSHDINTRLSVIRGVAEGLLYLHENQVVHGDLQPNNVLIHDDGHPLLCDFGCAKLLTSREYTTRDGPTAGVCRYQAPELFSGEDTTKASDVYSLATTAYALWTGMEPFHDTHQNLSIVARIVMNDARPQYPDPAPVGTEGIWKIFEDSWKLQPGDRLDAKQVVERLDDLGN